MACREFVVALALIGGGSQAVAGGMPGDRMRWR